MAAFSDHFSSSCPLNYPYTQCCFLLLLSFIKLRLFWMYLLTCLWFVFSFQSVNSFISRDSFLSFFIFFRDSFSHDIQLISSFQKYMYLKILVDVSLLYMECILPLLFLWANWYFSFLKNYTTLVVNQEFYAWTIFRF